MNDSLAISGSSLAALAEEYRAVANNLANANTTGFKKHVGQFHHVLSKMTDHPETVTGPQAARFDRKITSRMRMDFTQGTIESTDRPLDVALEGEGFFVLETPKGPRYSRNGMFRLSETGQLVDGLGRSVAGTGGPIVVPRETSVHDVTIGRDGTVSAAGEKIGQLEIVKFENPHELIPIGHSAYRVPADVRPMPTQDARLHQGHLERSNVKAIEELVNLIRISRLYEANVKSVNAHDERVKSLLAVAKG